MARYGYICASDEDQARTEMRKLKIAPNKIFIDMQMRKSSERPEYGRMLMQLRPDDIVFVKSLDHLGHSGAEIGNQWRIITQGHGADIVVIDEPLLDTRISSAPVSAVALAVITTLESSRSKNSYIRQAEGIRESKAKGVQFGRPEIPLPEDFEETVARWERKELTLSQTLTRVGLKESTFFRRLRQLREKEQQTTVSNRR